MEVELDRTKVLGSFYAIPNFYVKWLSQKCDTFLNKIQKINNNMNEGSEDDENDLNMDIDEIEKNYGKEKFYLRNWGTSKNSEESRRKTRK